MFHLYILLTFIQYFVHNNFIVDFIIEKEIYDTKV